MIKTFVVLLIVAAMAGGCGKSAGPKDPDDDEHDQGNIMSFNKLDIAPDLAPCSRNRCGHTNLVS